MSSKTRKLIWSVPLMATLAVVGALAVFVALGMPNANPAQAQDDRGPTNVTAVAGNEQITLVWTRAAIPGLNGYEIQAKTGSDDFAVVPVTDAAGTAPRITMVDGVLVDDDGLDSPTITKDTTSVVISGLDNDDSYDVRIKATAVGVDDSDWVSASATPEAQPAPEAPGNLRVTEVTATLITIEWDEAETPSGTMITGYTVDVGGNAVSTSDLECKDDDGTDTATNETVDGNCAADARQAEIQASVDDGEVTITVTATNNGGGGEGPAATVKETPRVVIDGEIAGSLVASDGNSPSGKVEVTLTSGTITLPIGGVVVIYLDDKFQVPDTIPTGSVTFAGNQNETGNGQEFDATSVIVDDGDSDDIGDDTWAIIAKLPDMNPSSGDDASNGITAASDMTLRIYESAGIKNPSEAGDYKFGFQIVGSPSAQDFDRVLDVQTRKVIAKAALDDEKDKRGYELTITGKGLNSGRKATAYVMSDSSVEPSNCDALAASDKSESVGSGTVGSDHTVVVAVTVTSDDFSPGKTNYVCLRDDNSPDRRSTNVKPFELEPSIAAEPAEVNSGDEVTVKLNDFPSPRVVGSVNVAGTKNWNNDDDDTNDDFEVELGDKELTFDMPGGVSGVIEISVDVDGTKKQTTVTVVASSLTLSRAEVAPNESIVISGDGFSEKSYILVSEFKIDDQPLVVDESGSEPMNIDGDSVQVVKTTSTGSFSATVKVWAATGATDNPALDADTYKIKVKDASGFSGSAEITILEPTLMVTPTAAGPRDYITINGVNWPVSTSDDDRDVNIRINEVGGDGNERNRNASIDSTGRFNYEYQLRSNAQLGKEHTITVSFGKDDGDNNPGDIEEEITFLVPSSNVVITPSAAGPGDEITLEITGMPIYRLVEEVVIDGADRLRDSFTTNADGDVTVDGIIVPYADAGFFPVRIQVGEETAIVQLEILAESDVRGAASPLPEAVTDLGDSVVRIFHFNTSSKVWTFYDPREEFEGLNTLTELAAGQPYWILVSEDVENVVLNGRTRDLTCVGGDCWNQLVW